MQTNPIQPLKILSKLDSACRQILDKNNPAPKSSSIIWSGIAFQILDNNLVIQSTYVSEILNVNLQNNLSKMPGAKAWLLGLISLRGQPMSVIDLKQYLFKEPSETKKNSRILVVKQNNHLSGLLLEDVFGLKQFPKGTDNLKENVVFSAEIKPFIDQTFDVDGIAFGNFSIPQLTNNEDYANAAR